VLEPADPGVLAVLRRHPEGDLLELYNVTESWRPWPADRLGRAGRRPMTP
jgi:amylosucrase